MAYTTGKITAVYIDGVKIGSFTEYELDLDEDIPDVASVTVHGTLDVDWDDYSRLFFDAWMYCLEYMN